MSSPVGVKVRAEIWSDVVCPWCYLGKRRFERALASFDHGDEVEVTYRSFELGPAAAPGVVVPTVELLATRYGMSARQAVEAQREMERRASLDGLVFRLGGLSSGNTRDAHRLLQLAKARHLQVELVERLYRAHFTDQVSIFDHRSLAGLAGEVGLDGDEVAGVLASDAYADAVEADEQMARELGATGVPFFVINRRYGISGAQSAELIVQTLERALADAATS